MRRSASIPAFVKPLVLLLLIILPTHGAEEAPTKPTGTQAHVTKRIWARDLLWTDTPKLEVAEWLTKEPDLEGKFILVEFWRTWCGACRRMSPRMNELHRKYGDELVVIAITGEPADKVKAALPGWKKEYFVAIDKPRPQEANDPNPKDPPAPAGDDATDGEQPDAEDGTFRSEQQGAYEAHFGVWGWPHAVLLEPKHRAVIWQGFPGLKGHELTPAMVGKYLARGRQTKTEDPDK